MTLASSTARGGRPELQQSVGVAFSSSAASHLRFPGYTMLPCSSVYPVRPALDACSRILTAQGVGELQFVVTEKGEKSYLNSRLWSRREYERLLCEGASQAFCTRLPKVSVHSSLSNCLDGLEGQEDRLALDNYESSLPLGAYHPFHSRTVLAVGAERGWSAAERDRLRALDFTLANVGQRVLKTETAAIALPRGPGPPGPRPRPHRAGPAGCRAVGGGRRYERSVLRPSPGVGGPCWPGCLAPTSANAPPVAGA